MANALLHANLELATRIERAGIAIVEDYARAHAALSPASDLEILRLPSGLAVYAGLNSPMSQVNGLGMEGPVDQSDFERLEELYFRRGGKPQIVVCPFADPSVIELLGKRGYRPIEFENVLVGPVEVVEIAPRLNITISPVQPGEANLYAETIGPNFAPDGILTTENRDMILAMFGMENGTALLARIDGQAVGGGALWIQDGIAWLAGGATLPPFRNRGVQTALFHARMAMAREAGCDLVEMGSTPGSQSQRSAERRGLRVVYTKVVMTREP